MTGFQNNYKHTVKQKGLCSTYDIQCTEQMIIKSWGRGIMYGGLFEDVVY